MKESHIRVLHGTVLFQSHWKGSPIHGYVHQTETGLCLACWREELKSVLITRRPDNHSMLIADQVFLLDYPTSIIVGPHLKRRHGGLRLFHCGEMLNLKQTRKRVTAGNGWITVPLHTTINLSFAMHYLVLFDSVVGVKKSFRIQTYLQNINIKCVNIYI